MGNDQNKEPVDSVGGYLLDPKNEARVKAIFDKFDADKSGQLDTVHAFSICFNLPGYKFHFCLPAIPTYLIFLCLFTKAEFKKFYTMVVAEALGADPAKRAAAEANPELYKGLFEVGATFSFEICDKDRSGSISYQEFKTSMPAILAKTKEQYKKDLAAAKKK
jgi:hypothetical protein